VPFLCCKQLDFVEGHGTGTKAGDPVELRAVSTVLRRHLAAAGIDGPGGRKQLGMTSIKSLLGHCKAASGGWAGLGVGVLGGVGWGGVGGWGGGGGG
jgi:acyl transferase domain-containing protein